MQEEGSSLPHRYVFTLRRRTCDELQPVANMQGWLRSGNSVVIFTCYRQQLLCFFPKTQGQTKENTEDKLLTRFNPSSVFVFEFYSAENCVFIVLHSSYSTLKKFSFRDMAHWPNDTILVCPIVIRKITKDRLIRRVSVIEENILFWILKEKKQ